MVFAIGCEADDGGHHHHWKDGDQPALSCSSFTSCGTCTPVLGCGWCAYEGGGGACTTGPDQCSGHTFRWNWDPVDCPAGDDAGSDASSEASSEAATEASADAPADAASEAAAEAGDDASDDAASEAAAEAGDDAAPDTATSSDTGTTTDTAPACKLPEGATASCALTSGGKLCGPGDFTLACHPSGGATPTPDGSLHCSTALTASDATYYCCPCAP